MGLKEKKKAYTTNVSKWLDFLVISIPFRDIFNKIIDFEGKKKSIYNKCK
jgi:hypothetical protein